MASSSTIKTFITQVSFYYPREMNKNWVNTPGSDSTARVPPELAQLLVGKKQPDAAVLAFGGEAFVKDSVDVVLRDPRPIVAHFTA